MGTVLVSLEERTDDRGFGFVSHWERTYDKRGGNSTSKVKETVPHLMVIFLGVKGRCGKVEKMDDAYCGNFIHSYGRSGVHEFRE
jgi:hypothetical protein